MKKMLKNTEFWIGMAIIVLAIVFWRFNLESSKPVEIVAVDSTIVAVDSVSIVPADTVSVDTLVVE